MLGPLVTLVLVKAAISIVVDGTIVVVYSKRCSVQSTVVGTGINACRRRRWSP